LGGRHSYSFFFLSFYKDNFMQWYRIYKNDEEYYLSTGISVESRVYYPVKQVSSNKVLAITYNRHKKDQRKRFEIRHVLKSFFTEHGDKYKSEPPPEDWKKSLPYLFKIIFEELY